jgi:fibronectin-binding autotransporter adhesin
LEAGKTYVVAWQYMSTDYTPFNDGSMMTLTHATDASKVPTLNNNTKNYALLGFTNPGTGNYATDSYGSTGWQLATITVPVTGDYILGFASFNLGDTALSPILLVDDLQGETYLNGTTFGPIAPNAGSNAPTTGGSVAPACPNSSTCSDAAFNANTGFTNRANIWSQQQGNRVIIEQVGNYNAATITQSGNKNYVEIDLTGSNNSTTVNQTTAGASTANYIEALITGNSNTVNLIQNGSGGTRGIMAIVNNNSNNLTVDQSGAGNHYAEVNLSGSNKTADVTQSGTAGHMVKIELTGGATSITTTQSGSTQQFYSITHNCAQASCAAITVTQGQ